MASETDATSSASMDDVPLKFLFGMKNIKPRQSPKSKKSKNSGNSSPKNCITKVDPQEKTSDAKKRKKTGQASSESVATLPVQQQLPNAKKMKRTCNDPPKDSVSPSDTQHPQNAKKKKNKELCQDLPISSDTQHPPNTRKTKKVDQEPPKESLIQSDTQNSPNAKKIKKTGQAPSKKTPVPLGAQHPPKDKKRKRDSHLPNDDTTITADPIRSKVKELLLPFIESVMQKLRNHVDSKQVPENGFIKSGTNTSQGCDFINPNLEMDAGCSVIKSWSTSKQRRSLRNRKPKKEGSDSKEFCKQKKEESVSNEVCKCNVSLNHIPEKSMHELVKKESTVGEENTAFNNSDQMENLLTEFEAELFNLYGVNKSKYRERARSNINKLKNNVNVPLSTCILSGKITVQQVCKMTPKQLSSFEFHEDVCMEDKKCTEVQISQTEDSNQKQTSTEVNTEDTQKNTKLAKLADILDTSDSESKPEAKDTQNNAEQENIPEFLNTNDLESKPEVSKEACSANDDSLLEIKELSENSTSHSKNVGSLVSSNQERGVVKTAAIIGQALSSFTNSGRLEHCVTVSSRKMDMSNENSTDKHVEGYTLQVSEGNAVQPKETEMPQEKLEDNVPSETHSNIELKSNVAISDNRFEVLQESQSEIVRGSVQQSKVNHEQVNATKICDQLVVDGFTRQRFNDSLDSNAFFSSNQIDTPKNIQRDKDLTEGTLQGSDVIKIEVNEHMSECEKLMDVSCSKTLPNSRSELHNSVSLGGSEFLKEGQTGEGLIVETSKGNKEEKDQLSKSTVEPEKLGEANCSEHSKQDHEQGFTLEAIKKEAGMQVDSSNSLGQIIELSNNKLTSSSSLDDVKVERNPTPSLELKLWEGYLRLNGNVTAMATAYFKSGGKAQTANWSKLVEIKGRVKLDVFEKFLQELPLSRNRSVMIISFCWMADSSESDLTAMQETANSYKQVQRVGYAELNPGIDLYVCPPDGDAINMLFKHGFMVESQSMLKNMEVLIGFVVWRRSNTASKPEQLTSKKLSYSSITLNSPSHFGGKERKADLSFDRPTTNTGNHDALSESKLQRKQWLNTAYSEVRKEDPPSGPSFENKFKSAVQQGFPDVIATYDRVNSGSRASPLHAHGSSKYQTPERCSNAKQLALAGTLMDSPTRPDRLECPSYQIQAKRVESQVEKTGGGSITGQCISQTKNAKKLALQGQLLDSPTHSDDDQEFHSSHYTGLMTAHKADLKTHNYSANSLDSPTHCSRLLDTSYESEELKSKFGSHIKALSAIVNKGSFSTKESRLQTGASSSNFSELHHNQETFVDCTNTKTRAPMSNISSGCLRSPLRNSESEFEPPSSNLHDPLRYKSRDSLQETFQKEACGRDYTKISQIDPRRKIFAENTRNNEDDDDLPEFDFTILTRQSQSEGYEAIPQCSYAQKDSSECSQSSSAIPSSISSEKYNQIGTLPLNIPYSLDSNKDGTYSLDSNKDGTLNDARGQSKTVMRLSSAASSTMYTYQGEQAIFKLDNLCKNDVGHSDKGKNVWGDDDDDDMPEWCPPYVAEEQRGQNQNQIQVQDYGFSGTQVLSIRPHQQTMPASIPLTQQLPQLAVTQTPLISLPFLSRPQIHALSPGPPPLLPRGPPSFVGNALPFPRPLSFTPIPISPIRPIRPYVKPDFTPVKPDDAFARKQ